MLSNELSSIFPLLFFSKRDLTHFVVSPESQEFGARPSITSRDFRKLLTHLATFSDSHIELGRLFSVRALRRTSVANRDIRTYSSELIFEFF